MMAIRVSFVALSLAVLVGRPATVRAQDASDLHAEIDSLAESISGDVIAWRRDLHQNPELGNREFRTAGVVADHLRSLGLDEVRTGVAHTGVVGILRGGRRGPVVGLRADMDALPVRELTDLPFASTVTAEYNGEEVGVMHACGHDVHTAVLMGVATILADMRNEIPGTVVFLFQPAEEGAPHGEEGGAELMIAEGAVESPRPDAYFGLHTAPFPTGLLGWRSGDVMASADEFTITVIGRQTHGATPEAGIDPIVVAAQIVLALQTIPSRQVAALDPVVISVGKIEGGVRFNIIPDTVRLSGTIRTLDPAVQEAVHAKISLTAEKVAESAGARATVEIRRYYPVTRNDPDLVAASLPSLRRVVGEGGLIEIPPLMVAEDFSFFARQAPGFYFQLGVNAPGVGYGEAASNHSPQFFVNEDAIGIGVRAIATLAVDYLERGGG
ncbi:MAG: amidohydrolase [Candidatus Palauibacterales bacterium]|jgi:amidohydrolase|nr:amidohydrolase [Candidatus Palauibacterales bacterium]MDP2484008.1 amidohydrolase [Candidatus Palauibacterales bacterium]